MRNSWRKTKENIFVSSNEKESELVNTIWKFVRLKRGYASRFEDDFPFCSFLFFWFGRPRDPSLRKHCGTTTIAATTSGPWIYALASRISTVTLCKTVSVMLLGWFGGDLFDFVETADAFPLLPRLPRRDPVRDPGDRDFLAKVSRAFTRQHASDVTRKAGTKIRSPEEPTSRRSRYPERRGFFVTILKGLQWRW